ncbi:interferon-inducible GTPase 5-like isoform X2 [Salarias fasciatus]|uniref:Interferon-inducible GTPase 5-like n=2 Tax=Salarias fasciatus TaxID=181472 RepID=A0A672I0K0_SALFA|nr:interferon-inducible GTPase 5-like isoform X2 [Salarias fasciatus]XP_029972498.1 interferon-inducible GTPase 5-like isoform X2 [Salarias fasciatus]
MDMEDQWDVITKEELLQIQEEMEKSPDKGLAKINEYLEKQNNTPLNIAITGESGSGKSTFINAFRGINDSDEGAAPTGPVETTVVVESYPHPNHPNVTLWDLPGVGTPNFPADEYLEKVGFERFDFFIIIAAFRFKENDVKLALEIKRMGKKFYFLRSKIDSDISNEERRKKNFNRQKTLDDIRENCIQGLRDQGIDDPQVFLVSSFELHQFDFHLLEETLERELPAHKRNAFLYALPNISKEIIKKKKEAYQAQIKYHAAVSSVGAAVPVPGLSTAVDLALVVGVVTQYVNGFGLDKESLERLSVSSGVPYSELVSVMTSKLGGTTITPELIKKVLSQLALEAVLMVAEEVSRFFLFIGIPVAMCLSGYATSRILNFFLDQVAEDAQRVFEKAVEKNSEV